MTDDIRDLAAARAGDATAFARIYDRHAPTVLSICRRRDLAAAEDDLQETFARAHDRLDQLDDPRRLGPWLYRIAINVCCERRRADVRRDRRESTWSARNDAATGDGADPDALAGADRREQLALLGAALEQLDERERLALHFYYHEVEPARAAADALRLSTRGYYALLQRARRRLADLMGVHTR